MRRLGCRVILYLGLLLAAANVRAQVSGSFALLSDYRYRGVSLSDRGPALQGGVAYDHGSGLYAGVLASTVHINGADSSLGAQFYAGYAHLLDQRVSLDAGAARYLYPDSPTRGSYDYTELYAGVARDRLHARLHYSDGYFGTSAQTIYAEINTALDLGEIDLGKIDPGKIVVLAAHVGYLKRWGQSAYSSAPRAQWDVRLGLGTELAGLTVELSVVATDVPSDQCPGSDRACAPGLVLSIGRDF